VSGAGRGRLRALVGEVASEGTDPDALLAVLGWTVRPRRSAEALRRRCIEQERAGTASSPAARLATAAGRPGAEVEHAVEQVLATWQEVGVRVALVGDPHYPARLAAGWPAVEAPTLLAWRGGPPTERTAVALIGARRATGYGVGVTAWLAESLARAGVRIVSGGAVGIDAAAHGAAAEEEGGTTVVLGCGHGVAYPRGHAAPGGLFERVLRHGGSIVSELLPWQPPRAGTVRARNRIVAGLSDAVIVVEGGERSGSLVTATAAAERGIPVLAVPGDIRAPGSVAPHRLLTEGATPCTGPADVLDLLPVAGGSGAPSGSAASASVGADPSPVGRTGLPPPVHAALVAAWPRPLRIDELATSTGCALPTLLAAVTRARVAGILAEGVDGVRLRRAP
jgi:DNA processing protein